MPRKSTSKKFRRSKSKKASKSKVKIPNNYRIKNKPKSRLKNTPKPKAKKWNRLPMKSPFGTRRMFSTTGAQSDMDIEHKNDVSYQPKPDMDIENKTDSSNHREMDIETILNEHIIKPDKNNALKTENIKISSSFVADMQVDSDDTMFYNENKHNPDFQLQLEPKKVDLSKLDSETCKIIKNNYEDLQRFVNQLIEQKEELQTHAEYLYNEYLKLREFVAVYNFKYKNQVQDYNLLQKKLENIIAVLKTQPNHLPEIDKLKVPPTLQESTFESELNQIKSVQTQVISEFQSKFERFINLNVEEISKTWNENVPCRKANFKPSKYADYCRLNYNQFGELFALLKNTRPPFWLTSATSGTKYSMDEIKDGIRGEVVRYKPTPNTTAPIITKDHYCKVLDFLMPNHTGYNITSVLGKGVYGVVLLLQNNNKEPKEIVVKYTFNPDNDPFIKMRSDYEIEIFKKLANSSPIIADIVPKTLSDVLVSGTGITDSLAPIVYFVQEKMDISVCNYLKCLEYIPSEHIRNTLFKKIVLDMTKIFVILKEINCTHFDLHNENVLIKFDDKGVHSSIKIIDYSFFITDNCIPLFDMSKFVASCESDVSAELYKKIQIIFTFIARELFPEYSSLKDDQYLSSDLYYNLFEEHKDLVESKRKLKDGPFISQLNKEAIYNKTLRIYNDAYVKMSKVYS
jgi:hypothetical protein